MRTGLIIEAEITEKGLNDFRVKRVHVVGEEWEGNENEGRMTVNDARKWIELMVEGITTVIYSAHDAKIKDSAEFLRETIDKLGQAFAVPAKTSIDVDAEIKNYKEIKSDKQTGSDQTMTGK